MNKVAVSAAVGVGVAGAAFAMPYAGVQIPLETIILAGAALTMGAASAVLTSAILTRPAKKTRNDLMSERLSSSGLILKFPKPSESMALSIRPETRPEHLDVVKNPGRYKKDIVVWLRGNKEEKFNPVLLKQLFTALRREGNFLHVILTAKNDEFIGYIPASHARTRFCGPDAEVQIARYIVDVFADDANSVNLREILGGAGKSDVISDTAEVTDAIRRMAGGFKRLVVLHNGYHRKPIGLLDFNELMSGALTGAAPKALGIATDLRL
jgi:hypothetical protein